MLRQETVTSFKKIFDKYFETNLEIKKSEDLALELLEFMHQITKPVAVSNLEEFKSYSLQSREDVLINQNII